jgi:hypothetical protein
MIAVVVMVMVVVVIMIDFDDCRVLGWILYEVQLGQRCELIWRA